MRVVDAEDGSATELIRRSDLTTYAADNAVMHLAGAETVTGAKTFTGGALSRWSDPLSSYRGAWSSAMARYYAGEMVTYNGQLYVANADQTVLSFVGTTSNTNTTTKTTATQVGLAAMTVGDLVVVTIALQPRVASPTTALYTAPSWGQTIVAANVAANGTDVNAALIWEVRYYTLTQADITAGSLTVPAQTSASNASNAFLSVQAMQFHGAALDGGAQPVPGATATGTGTAVSASAIGGFSNTNASEYPVWAAALATDTVASVNSTSWANGTLPATASYTNVGLVTGLSSAGTAMAYRDAVGLDKEGAFGGPTFNATLSTASPWVARAAIVVVKPNGVFDPTQWTALSDSEPVGTVKMFAAGAAPAGYLLCNAQIVSQLTYPALFAVIGTTYGTGTAANGDAGFKLPDLTDRVPVGASATKAVASQGGTINGAHTHSDAHSHDITHTHTTPNHSHPLGAAGAARVMVGSGSVIVDTANNTLGVTPNWTATATGWTRTSGGTASAASAALSGTTESTGGSGTTTAQSTVTSGARSTATTGTPNSAGTNPGLPAYTTLNYIIKY